ncbi:DgyrCDS9104 [Dimorphilus gyrociliatus]|uniref:Flavin-containing monooxygenase n=1 Tax=Dimorphilus gyrociliatus TaxID=2664684 RepID=A0A7I8VYB0_9ANNE|nr:DgyrCDS9104 [Dimorphilus gyrociliatus]
MSKVCIIGGGVSGLPTIKSCLEENLEPTCFEKHNDIGGIWAYTTDTNRFCASESTILNLSKEMNAYSDFRPKAEYPPFLTREHYHRYLKAYAKNFKLMKYIKLEHEILKVERNGRTKWFVTVKDLTSGNISKLDFDFVIICTGRNSSPNIVNLKGSDDFQGRIIHSYQYKNWKKYEDKRVVVVGSLNTGLDIACELSRVCNQVFLVSRKGQWILPRLLEGKPTYASVSSRFKGFLLGTLPLSVINFIRKIKHNSYFDHELLGLKPEFEPSDKTGTGLNCEIAARLICGRVMLKPKIERLHQRSVEYEDGTVSDTIDEIILCTGYNNQCPILNTISDIEGKINNETTDLYRLMFPITDYEPTIAVVGLFGVPGGVAGVSEMQSRWICNVFKKTITLPNKSYMKKKVKEFQSAMKKRYKHGAEPFNYISYIPTMNTLASEIGCKPNFWKLFLTKPKLAFKLYFGPMAPYQYRLFGPNKWEGAEKASTNIILDTFSSIMKEKKKTKTTSSIPKLFILVVILSQTNNEEFKRNKSLVCAMINSTDKFFDRSHIRETVEDMLINIYEMNETAFCPLNLLRKVCGVSIMSIIMSKEYGLDDDELGNLIRLIGVWYDSLGTWNFLYYLLPFPSLFLKFFAKDTLEASRQVKEFVRESIKEHELCLDTENPRDFIDYMLSEYKGKVDLNRIIDTMYVTFPDAIHTISFLVYLSLCYLGYHQRVQENAQQLLDLVTKGTGPSLNDREKLAYIEAIILETLRISNMVPMLTGHFPTKDSTLNGYKIPKSSTIVGLLNSTHFNEEFFAEPKKFKPERFLDDEGNLLVNKKLLSFGIGQRMCIGKEISIKESFLLTSNILKHFQVSIKQDLSLDDDEFERIIMSPISTKTEVIFKPRRTH